jgi:hypothetical protein
MLKKNGNQSNIDLQNALLAIKGGSKIVFTTRLWGVPITSLKNHLYGVTLTRHKGKSKVLDNVEEIALVDYIKQMQRIGHPITLM